MTEGSTAARRYYHSHSTARAEELNGISLATFWQRLIGYIIDVMVAVTIWAPAEFLWRRYLLHEQSFAMKWDFHEKGNIAVMLLYWGLATYITNGRTVGKLVSRTRVLSLTGNHIGLWQSIERALGYGAAVLEGGLGFLQFFWDRNRMCAQDRLAETIVVDTRNRASQSGLAATP